MFGLATLEDPPAFERARSRLLEEQRLRHVQVAPLLALLDGERALATGDPGRALEHARRAMALPSIRASWLLMRAFAQSGDHEACARIGTEILPDRQSPGALGGMELLPARHATQAGCAKAAGLAADMTPSPGTGASNAD